MFVAQQAARSRVVRTTFVVVCLVPCAVLVAWAVWRRGAAHRDRLVGEWTSVLGIPIEVGRVEHLRPGALRLLDVALTEGPGGEPLRLPLVEVESSATEVRLRAAELVVTPAAIAFARRLASAWLDEPTRFRRDVVVDVGRFGFRSSADGGVSDDLRGGLRIECVGTDEGRAIRLRAEPENGDWLIVQALPSVGMRRRRLAVRGRTTTPVPARVVVAALGWSAGWGGDGTAATFVGTIDAESGEQGWDGTFSADVNDVDLALVSASLPWRAGGTARVAIDECRVEAGRVAALRGRIVTGAGGIGGDGLDALVTSLGCRAGSGWRPAAPGAAVAFLRASARFEIDARGLRLTAADDPSLVVGASGPILEPPAATVPLERVARALSPTTTVAVPATPLSGWLLAVLPFPGTAPADPPGDPSVESSRVMRRGASRGMVPGAGGAGNGDARR